MKIYVTYTYHFTYFKCTSQWPEACSLSRNRHHHPFLNILIFPNQDSAPTAHELKGAVSRAPCSLCPRRGQPRCSLFHPRSLAWRRPWWTGRRVDNPDTRGTWSPCFVGACYHQGLHGRIPQGSQHQRLFGQNWGELMGGHGVWSLAAGSWSKTGQMNGGATKVLLLFELFKVKCR